MQSQSFIGVIIHLHIYTQVAIYWRIKMAETHTHTHTLDLACTNTYTSRGAPLPGALPLHTQTCSYLLGIWFMMTDTHPYPRLIACTNTHSSFTITGAIPSHACSFTRNLRFYFTSVGQVFLVETVVLQTTVRHSGVQRPFSSLIDAST